LSKRGAYADARFFRYFRSRERQESGSRVTISPDEIRAMTAFAGEERARALLLDLSYLLW
jgi:hypothetical protein